MHTRHLCPMTKMHNMKYLTTNAHQNNPKCHGCRQIVTFYFGFMLLWKSRHFPADAYPRRSRPLVLPEIWSTNSQRSDLGRLFGRHGTVPTHTNLNPRTVILFDCHFEILELLRWVYSNILCLYLLHCVMSHNHDLMRTTNMKMRFSCPP